MARPSKYKEEFNEIARKLALLGLTDAEIGYHLGVDERTINNWKDKYPEFFQSLKDGKELADCEVVDSLYTKAKAGDTTACIFWLKNRRSQNWRDRQDIPKDENDETGSQTIRDAVESLEGENDRKAT